MKVIAAIDSSTAARPVLAVARAIGHVLGAPPEAVHVALNGDATPRAEAEAAGVPITLLAQPVASSICRAASEPDVAALVMGIRRTPGGARPAGSVARAVMTSVQKPVVLVPPNCPLPYRLRHVLVPLAGEPSAAASVRKTLQVVRARDIDVVVLHVYDEASLPAFDDQPQHETDAWAREFLARYAPLPEQAVRLALRVGSPSEEVLALSQEAGSDLIAMGWSQDLSSDRARIVQPILERSKVPVLLLPVIEAKHPAGHKARPAARLS